MNFNELIDLKYDWQIWQRQVLMILNDFYFIKQRKQVTELIFSTTRFCACCAYAYINISEQNVRSIL